MIPTGGRPPETEEGCLRNGQLSTIYPAMSMRGKEACELRPLFGDAVGPPAAPLGHAGHVTAIASQTTVGGECGERPARSDEERFHVALKRDEPIEIGERERSAGAVLDDEKVHTCGRFFTPQQQLLASPLERPH